MKTLIKNRLIAKSWSDQVKNKVRSDVVALIRMTEEGSQAESMKCSAATLYLIEKCWDKRKGDVEPKELLAFL